MAHKLEFSDNIFLMIKQKGIVTKSDLKFITTLIDHLPGAIVAGVRLLAFIGEEGFAPRDKIIEFLLQYLIHEKPRVRIAAIEAFWQMAETSVKPNLLEALKKEQHPEVRANLEHVIGLFE